MTVEQTDSIDGIGFERTTGSVVLMISDHLPWDGNHLEVLEKKLAAYVRFVESGQILESFPTAGSAKKVINVVHMHDPTPDAERFLRDAAAALAKRGLGFRHGPLPAPY